MPRKSSDQSDLLKVVESLSAEVASLKAQVAKLSKAPRGKAGADPDPRVDKLWAAMERMGKAKLLK